MIHYQRSRTINANPESIWAVLSRYMHIDEFAPQVVSVEALTSGDHGVGSKRRCIFEDGNSVVEEVTEWEANRGYRVRLSDMEPMPLKEAHAEIALKAIAPDQTEVIWSMDYHVKFGPLGWLLGQTMMKMMMGKVLDGNLKGLAKKIQATQLGSGEMSSLQD